MRPIKAACILHIKPVIAVRNWRTEITLWPLQESPTKLLIWVHFNGRYFTVLLSCFSATEVKIIGFGHDEESGLDYWLVNNSWGTEWGDKLLMLFPCVKLIKFLDKIWIFFFSRGKNVDNFVKIHAKSEHVEVVVQRRFFYFLHRSWQPVSWHHWKPPSGTNFTKILPKSFTNFTQGNGITRS